MKTVVLPVKEAGARIGDEVIVYHVGPRGYWTTGQGGQLAAVTNSEIALDTKCYGRLTYPLADHEIVVEVPFEASECLQFGDDCSGAVELQTVGQSLKAWPRCRHHADQRQDNYENSSERWADSDVPPPWLDRYGTGEQWTND